VRSPASMPSRALRISSRPRCTCRCANGLR
jgi:hypothetical protein